MISKKFITSSLIYTVSSALSTVASFLLLPFYTNTSLLRVPDFGVLSLYIGLSLLVQVFAGFGFDYYVNVAYHELKDDQVRLNSKIASLSGYLLIIGFALVLVFAFLAPAIIKVIAPDGNSQAARYVIMSVATGAFNAYFRFYNSLLVNREKPWVYFWSNIFNFVTTVAFSIIILKAFPLTLEGPMWGRLLSCACIFIWAFIDITRLYGLALRSEFFWPTIQFCFPLVITTVLQWVLSYSDRYIIKPMLFNKELAIFDLAVRATLVTGFLLDGLSSAMSPRIFTLLNAQRAGNNNSSEIHKYYSGFNLVTLIVIPTSVLLIPLLLPLFITDNKYLASFVYFGIISAGFATRGIQNLFVYPIHFQRKTSRLIVINAISALLQIGTSFLLVRYFKLAGAAYATVIVKVLMTILFAWFCREFIDRKMNVIKMVALPAIVIIVMCLLELAISDYGFKMHLIHFVEAIIVLTMVLAVYRSEAWDMLLWTISKLQMKWRRD